MIVVTRSVNKHVPKERWIASLSNGETIYEDIIPDLPPAWERLARYVEEHNLSITNLRLQIANTEVKLPSNQQGYIQKKVAWTLGGVVGGVRKCIGYAQNGLALIYEVDTSHGSRTQRTSDPGSPYTIYSLGVRKESHG